jgi:hypothetical protein
MEKYQLFVCEDLKLSDESQNVEETNCQSIKNKVENKVEYIVLDKGSNNNKCKNEKIMTKGVKILKTALRAINMCWSKQCKHCGRKYLNGATVGEMRLCCQDGKLLLWKKIPFNLYQLILENFPHLSRSSSVYNNMLSMSATGVENDHGGGFEKINGPHAVN